MKRTIASILAASALAAAGGAVAQTLEDRIERLEDRVDRGVDQNLLTENQADEFRNLLQGVRDTRDQLDTQGELNDQRRRDLDTRLDHLAYRLGRDEYFTRYGAYRGYYRNWDSEDESNQPPSPY
jgi:hypothetical protein